MGKTKRSGNGYGMDEFEAQRSFRQSLNREYGEDSYAGGGNSITEWLSSKCVEKPILAAAPSKTKSVRVASKADGKLVNGFIVTNETPELSRLQLTARYSDEAPPAPPTVEEYTLTQAEAKKKADEMAKKHNTLVYVIPGRLWLDERTKRLSSPSRVLEVTPTGGKEAKVGKWAFEVEVRE
jgi:hypothetical protein